MAMFSDDEKCEYDKMRDENIKARMKLLDQLHLGKKYREEYEDGYACAQDHVKKPKKPKTKKKNSLGNDVINSPVTRRRSARLLSKSPDTVLMEEENVSSDDTPKRRTYRENVFGKIPGIPVGTVFASRLDASHAGVHRPTVAGIHGNEAEGCYSLSLSGGYEDDVDLGDRFTYTGEGGRDLKGTKAKPKNLRTAAQSKDQVLTRGNLALTNNIKYKRPVRVLRGYKLRSRFAPLEGYRYDGLYNVERYWAARGKAGFMVYKFSLQRCKNQDPAPWDVVNSEEVKTMPEESESSSLSSKDSSSENSPGSVGHETREI